MKRLYVAELWNNFAKKAISANAPAVQKRVMRMAFYAGVHQGLFAMSKLVSGSFGEPTIEELNLVRAVREELEDFAARMERGET